MPSSSPTLSLNNVPHAPKIIKNLISVRKFTTDNSVTVAFDPFGFSVKDFQTGKPIMRCYSRGNLYPITNPINNQVTSTFAAISPKLWHDRLGHPGAPILDALRHNKNIDCNRLSSSSVYGSCVLGKHVKLSFVSSISSTTLPFYILHSDLWSSPIFSSAGHRYYVVLLN